MASEVLTVQEVSTILRVSYDTALTFVKFSGVPYIKVGRQYRVLRNEFEEFLKAHTVQ